MLGIWTHYYSSTTIDNTNITSCPKILLVQSFGFPPPIGWFYLGRKRHRCVCVFVCVYVREYQIYLCARVSEKGDIVRENWFSPFSLFPLPTPSWVYWTHLPFSSTPHHFLPTTAPRAHARKKVSAGIENGKDGKERQRFLWCSHVFSVDGMSSVHSCEPCKYFNNKSWYYSFKVIYMKQIWII